MTRAPGTTARCECGTGLIFAKTAKDALAPVEYNPADDGNVLVFRADGVLECRTFAGDTLTALRDQGVPLRRNHFAACALAERFRRGAAA